MVALPITLDGATEWEVDCIVSIESRVGTDSLWYHL